MVKEYFEKQQPVITKQEIPIEEKDNYCDGFGYV